MASVKALDLLPEKTRSFIKQFSELRNSLVHNAQNLELDLQKYFDGVETNKRKALIETILPLFMNVVPFFTAERCEQEIRRSFRFSLMIAVVSIMGEVAIVCEPSESTPKVP